MRSHNNENDVEADQDGGGMCDHDAKYTPILVEMERENVRQIIQLFAGCDII